MVTTTLLMFGSTQAVGLPEEVAFPDDVRDVEIMVVDSARVVVPMGRRWDYYVHHGLRVSDDFMISRDQPFPQGCAVR